MVGQWQLETGEEGPVFVLFVREATNKILLKYWLLGELTSRSKTVFEGGEGTLPLLCKGPVLAANWKCVGEDNPFLFGTGNMGVFTSSLC